MADRPNVLLLMTDQHRADCLGCYGNTRIHTPNIDRIAREGIRANRAYVTNPLCTPSRASILTGQSVSGHEAWNLGVPLPEETITLPKVLAEHGYRTGAIGKVHLTPQVAGCPEFPENVDFWSKEPDWNGPYFGFETVDLFVGHAKLIGHYGQYIKREHPELARRYDRSFALEDPTGAPHSWKCGFPVEHHSCSWIGERMLAFLKANDERPFFAQCSFPYPHFPFSPPAPYCYQYGPLDMTLPNQKEGDRENKPPHVNRYYQSAGGEIPLCDVTGAQKREVIAHTYGMISFVDDQVGKILDTLDELDLARNTIVIFCSDHGELLFDHGLLKKGPYPYEGLYRVPLLWRWPAGLPKDKTTDALFSLMDLAPTIAELAGIPVWKGVEGVDQSTVLKGNTVSVRNSVLIEYFHGRQRPCDGLRSKTLVTDRWKLTHYIDEPFGELYDLDNDPDEFVNLYNQTEFSSIRSNLVEQLMDLIAGSEERFGPRRAPA